MLFLIVFISLLVCVVCGSVIGRRQTSATGHEPGISTVDAAVFALVGLLLSFSFSGAQGRYEARLNALVKETNAIGTAYMRTDLLGTSDRLRARKLFAEYVDLRLKATRALPDLDAATISWNQSHRVSSQLWELAVHSTSDQAGSQDRTLVISGFNDLVDTATVSEVTVRTHLPKLIFAMLGVLCAIAVVLAGRALAISPQRKTLHIIVFPAVLACVLVGLVDLEYPSIGWIRLSAASETLESLSQVIHSANG